MLLFCWKMVSNNKLLNRITNFDISYNKEWMSKNYSWPHPWSYQSKIHTIWLASSYNWFGIVFSVEGRECFRIFHINGINLLGVNPEYEILFVNISSLKYVLREKNIPFLSRICNWWMTVIILWHSSDILLFCDIWPNSISNSYWEE